MKSFRNVVRVFTTSQIPDYDAPWNCKTPDSSTGSGVYVGGGRVLTGAHVIADATFIQVQKVGVPEKVPARVVAVSHDRDLALLAVDDITNESDFFAGVEPAELGDLPALRDRVLVVGFPVGGDEISVTEGVVSRVEVQRYVHSQRHLLAVTVDAAINDGNSGGPVYREGRVVGIAIQSRTDAENVGQIVPTPLIRTFLDGVATDRSPWVPGLGIVWQPLENSALRKALGVPTSGIRICEIDHGGSLAGKVRPDDALVSIDGRPIANNGTVEWVPGVRTTFSVVLSHRYVGDVLDYEIVRDGQRIALQSTLVRHGDLVDRSRYDQVPSWFVHGGLVFQPLTRNFLETWNRWWDKAPPEFVERYYCGMRTASRQELVVLSKVLMSRLTVGYEELANETVRAVNGVEPIDMRHFVQLVEGAHGLLRIHMSSGGVIVLDPAQVATVNDEILRRYRIPADRHPPRLGLPDTVPA